MELGGTHVLATASVEEKVPPFLRGQAQGWVHAEYGMLPRSTHQRTPREVTRGRPQGRTMEIQRLIARTLRAVTDLKALGERTYVIDVDVIQADGGTRTAGITAGYLALMAAVQRVTPGSRVFRDWLAAVSVGLKEGEVWLDLDFSEDSHIDVDFNCAMTAGHQMVELQASGEHGWFDQDQLHRMLEVAASGIDELVLFMLDAFPEGRDLIHG
jgi:ribonuclease PH